MPEKKSPFVPVDNLMPLITVEQAVEYYGQEMPEVRRLSKEIRTRCFLNCGKFEETNDRALAIQTEDPARRWKCWQKGCGKGGNLVSLCDLIKPGDNHGGRPRGERFKAVAADLVAMVEGKTRAEKEAAESTGEESPNPPSVNVPLARSENERARELVTLDEKFLLPSQTDRMPPAASRYFRTRPWLTDEVAKQWRIGYLPRDTGEDHQGGTMRGRVVYAYHSAEGELLTWFGRDPDYERKHQEWLASDRKGAEPLRHRFVKGFLRGRELFGQHRIMKASEAIRQQVSALGLIVVEGPNDVIRLSALRVPAVGLCSETITGEQAELIARLCEQAAGGIVTLLFDTDDQGRQGAKRALELIARVLPVRLGWDAEMYDKRFRGREPESLTPDEWEVIETTLRGNRK